MRIIGIDPSFSRSGICVIDDGVVVAAASVSVPAALKDGTLYNLPSTLQSAHWLASEIAGWWAEYLPADLIVIEVPAIQSMVGAYLLTIQQALYSYYPEGCRIFLIPPNAINGLVFPPAPKKPRKKSELVNYTPPEKLSKPEMKKQVFRYAVDRYDPDHLLSNHDEGSAAILGGIGALISSGTYTKSFKEIERLSLVSSLMVLKF